MEGHIPPKAPVQTDVTAWGWKEWFQKLYRFFVREADLAVNQTVSFTYGQEYMWPCDATAGNITATLPPANQWLGKKYYTKKIDSSANTVIVTAAGSDTIEGAASSTLSTQYSFLVLVSNGVSTWYILGTSSSGGGVASVQSGYSAGGSSSASAGEDARYFDVTITAVTNTAKCVVTILQQGGANTPATNAHLTSTTNLRVTQNAGATFNAFRYYIVEYQ